MKTLLSHAAYVGKSTLKYMYFTQPIFKLAFIIHRAFFIGSNVSLTTTHYLPKCSNIVETLIFDCSDNIYDGYPFHYVSGLNLHSLHIFTNNYKPIKHEFMHTIDFGMRQGF